MTEIVVVLTTVPSDFDAVALARALIDGRFAACVNILPKVRSIYRWKDAIEDAVEQQLVIKTTREKIDALWAAIRARHPYDMPEFIVMPVVEGSSGYLDWVRGSIT